MPTVSTPLYRLDPDARRAIVLELVGQAVEVDVRTLRGVAEGRIVTGELLSCARAELGAGTDVAVVRPLGAVDGRRDVAFSLAQVGAIRRLGRLQVADDPRKGAVR